MSDPVMPSFEEMVEAGANTVREMWPRMYGLTEGDARIYARAILVAVLPMVLKPAGEALCPPACKCGGADIFDHSHACVKELRDWHDSRERRARTVRGQIAKLMEAGDG